MLDALDALLPDGRGIHENMLVELSSEERAIVRTSWDEPTVEAIHQNGSSVVHRENQPSERLSTPVNIHASANGFANTALPATSTADGSTVSGSRSVPKTRMRMVFGSAIVCVAVFASFALRSSTQSSNSVPTTPLSLAVDSALSIAVAAPASVNAASLEALPSSAASAMTSANAPGNIMPTSGRTAGGVKVRPPAPTPSPTQTSKPSKLNEEFQ